MQKRLIQTKVSYKLFYSLWKETSHKPLKVAAAKKSFQSVYIIDTTCFDECFLFYMVTGSSIFYTNLSLPCGLVQPPCCCVLWNKYFQRSPHFMSVISTIIFQWCQYQRFKTKLLLLNIFLKKWFAHGVSFTLSDFVNVPHFPLKMEFSKLKLPGGMFFLLRAIIKVLWHDICSHKLFKWEVISENINTTLCK